MHRLVHARDDDRVDLNEAPVIKRSTRRIGAQVPLRSQREERSQLGVPELNLHFLVVVESSSTGKCQLHLLAKIVMRLGGLQVTQLVIGEEDGTRCLADVRGDVLLVIVRE